MKISFFLQVYQGVYKICTTKVWYIYVCTTCTTNVVQVWYKKQYPQSYRFYSTQACLSFYLNWLIKHLKIFNFFRFIRGQGINFLHYFAEIIIKFVNVPENLVHLNYVPNVPDSWYKLGTKNTTLNLSNIFIFFRFFRGVGVFFLHYFIKIIIKFELYNSLAFQKYITCLPFLDF